MGSGVKADRLPWLKNPSWKLPVNYLGRSISKLSPAMATD